MQLGLAQALFGFQQRQFTLAAFVVERGLRFQQGLLVFAAEDLVGQTPVFAEGLPGVGQEAGAFQIQAGLALDLGHGREAACPFLDHQAFTHQLQPGVALAHADERQPAVGKCHRLGHRVARRPRQRQRLLRQALRRGVVAALQVVVGQVRQAQHFLDRGAGIAGVGDGGPQRLQLGLAVAGSTLQEALRRHHPRHRQRVASLARQRQRFGRHHGGSLQLLGQRQRIGQGVAVFGAAPGRAHLVGQQHGLLVQADGGIELAAVFLDAAVCGHEAQAQAGGRLGPELCQGVGQLQVGLAERAVAPEPLRTQQFGRRLARRVGAAARLCTPAQFLCHGFHGRGIGQAHEQIAARHQGFLPGRAGRRLCLGQRLQRCGGVGAATQAAFDVVQRRGRHTQGQKRNQHDSESGH